MANSESRVQPEGKHGDEPMHLCEKMHNFKEFSLFLSL